LIYENNITSADVSPRGKRERSHIHYSKIIHSLVNYFDAPESAIEFIEACLIFHGYNDCGEWTATGAELAKAIALASSTDQHERIRDRLAKQRRRLAKWQDGKDSNGLSRPVLVSIKPVFEHDAQKLKYWYSLPIAELVKQSVVLAPVGAADRRIRSAVATVAKDHLLSIGLRPPSKVATRRHTPESQIKRGLAYLSHGILAENMPENDALEIVKNEVLENRKLLEVLRLLNQVAGIFPAVLNEIRAGIPADHGQTSAYKPFINTYAQNDGAAGAGAGATWHSGEDDEFEDEPPYFADRFDEVAR
jgi:hypothetical protein